MENFKQIIVPDQTWVPGMKTVMADRKDRNNVRLIPNIEYVQRQGIPLHLHLLCPEGCMPEMEMSKRYPLVVFVQGSAWGEQDIFAAIPQLAILARRGYMVASVKHRSSEIARFPGFLQDIKSAIRFLRANAQTYHIDPEQVAIWGDSSGGHAALMVGVTGDMEEFKTEDYNGVSDAVGAVVDFYGPTDVTRINDVPRNPVYAADKEHIPEDALFGGCVAQHPEIAQPGNPIFYVTEEKELPPFLIVHGDGDSVVPFNQSVLMYQKLRECRKMAEFYKVQGAEHGFFMWTEEVMDIVGGFLDAYFVS